MQSCNFIYTELQILLSHTAVCGFGIRTRCPQGLLDQILAIFPGFTLSKFITKHNLPRFFSPRAKRLQWK